MVHLSLRDCFPFPEIHHSFSSIRERRAWLRDHTYRSSTTQRNTHYLLCARFRDLQKESFASWHSKLPPSRAWHPLLLMILALQYFLWGMFSSLFLFHVLWREMTARIPQSKHIILLATWLVQRWTQNPSCASENPSWSFCQPKAFSFHPRCWASNCKPLVILLLSWWGDLSNYAPNTKWGRAERWRERDGGHSMISSTILFEHRNVALIEASYLWSFQL